MDKTKLKIDSEVASDKDKEEFLSILSTGEAKSGQKSKYAKTFAFYQDRISELVSKALRDFYERDSYKLLKSEETLENLEALRGRFMAYAFNDGRPITRSMLAWWAFEDEKKYCSGFETHAGTARVRATANSS